MHLLFDGLVRRGQHGTDSPLRLADGAATEAQAEVLFKLLLYLANALVKQTTEVKIKHSCGRPAVSLGW